MKKIYLPAVTLLVLFTIATYTLAEVVSMISATSLALAAAEGDPKSPEKTTDAAHGEAQREAMSHGTVEDQVNPQDAELTQQIRQELQGRKLSARAKNVQIVTINGNVTLKGTVPSMAERNQVYEVAKILAPKVKNNVTVKK